MHLAIGASAPSQSGGGSDSAPSAQSTTEPSEQERTPKVNPRVSEAISRGIADLTEMAPCHHFAEQALNILRFLAKKWNIDVEIKVGTEEENPRVTVDSHQSTRPVTSSLNFFAPNIMDSDFICDWGGPRPNKQFGAAARSSTGQGAVDHMSNAVENPLFWPFPMQGRPILPAGNELEEAGFELI